MIVVALLFLCQDVPSLSAQGAAAMRAERYAEAARVYRTLTVQDPNNPMWRFNLGMAHFSAGAHGEAATALATFLRARPQPGAAHLFLGVSWLKLQQPCQAIEPLEAALRWPQHPPSAWTELADAYQGCKRWEPAAKAYAEAAKLNPQHLRLLRQSAHCWRMARRYELAKPVFASLESSYAQDADFWFEYGDTLMRLDGAAAGLPWLKRAVAANPSFALAQSALGRALMELDRPADALPHLEAGAAEDPALLLSLSRAYRALQRPAEAAKAEADYKAKIGTPP